MYVLSSAKLDATSHRWLAALASFNFTLQYRAGRSKMQTFFQEFLIHLKFIINYLSIYRVDPRCVEAWFYTYLA
jgi:hypothetical protein